MSSYPDILLFQVLKGVGSKTLANLCQQYGSFEKVLSLWEEIITPKYKVTFSQASSLAQEEWQKIQDHGVFLICREDPSFAPFQDLAETPLVIYAKGNLDCLRIERNLAVVGTRTPSVYGKMVTQEWVAELTQMGTCIVSGLAQGIDTLAHQACLAEQGQTIGILGTGLAVIYPQENLGLAEKIYSSGGLLLSENLMDTQASRWGFPKRNRLIAKLSPLGVLLPEAGLNSGSLITASCVNQLGYPCYAVPGSILKKHSSGCHSLIQEGRACLVSAVSDIVLPESFRGKVKKKDLPALSQEEKLILQILKKRPLSCDDLLQSLGGQADLPKLLTLLTRMERKKIVKKNGFRYQITHP